MEDVITIEWMLGLLGLGIAAVLARVWKIPAIEQKLDNVVRETDKNRDKIHHINNQLHLHDLRITNLEKTKQENTKS